MSIGSEHPGWTSPSRPSEPIHCLVCGRDLLGVLPDHPRRSDVDATLVELDPELVRRGRERALQAGLSGCKFRLSDASNTDSYLGAVPANLVLVCGVFGNISDADVRGTISHLPELCAPHAAVIWTRGTLEPDLTPKIRQWFVRSGFVESSFTPISGTSMSVGCHHLMVPPRRFRSDRSIFTFLPKEARDTRHRTQSRRDG